MRQNLSRISEIRMVDNTILFRLGVGKHPNAWCICNEAKNTFFCIDGEKRTFLQIDEYQEQHGNDPSLFVDFSAALKAYNAAMDAKGAKEQQP